MFGPYREFQVSSLNGVQKRAARFANNINESGWETLVQCRLIAQICALYKAYTGGRARKAIGDRLLKPFYMSRDEYNQKIRIKKQRTDVGKYSFVKITIESCKQLRAGLLVSFSSKLNTFKKRDKTVVKSTGIRVK